MLHSHSFSKHRIISCAWHWVWRGDAPLTILSSTCNLTLVVIFNINTLFNGPRKRQSSTTYKKMSVLLNVFPPVGASENSRKKFESSWSMSRTFLVVRVSFTGRSPNLSRPQWVTYNSGWVIETAFWKDREGRRVGMPKGMGCAGADKKNNTPPTCPVLALSHFFLARLLACSWWASSLESKSWGTCVAWYYTQELVSCSCHSSPWERLSARVLPGMRS